MYSPYFENDYLKTSKFNLTIGELKTLDEVTFREWALNWRKEILYAWDELGIPLLGGVDEPSLIKRMEKVKNSDVKDFLDIDELIGSASLISSPTQIGNAATQFFPTLDKTKDAATDKSFYSHFANNDEISLNRLVGAFETLILRDPKHTHSKEVIGDKKKINQWIKDTNGNPDLDFFFVAKATPNRAKIYLTKEEIDGLLKKKIITSDKVQDSANGNGELFQLRQYDPKQRIADKMKGLLFIFTGRQVQNFNPFTAKYVYSRYTEHFKNREAPIIIYDPSAGWGGRILGALGLDDRAVHYVGTDPNTDHWMNEEQKTKYEYLADYFIENVGREHPFTCEIFQDGSEVIHQNPDFKKYKNKVDLAFTSPPYFAAEIYNDQETQSHNQFDSYEKWRDGFLKRTLKNCIDWLADDGVLAINMADYNHDGQLLPLEQDTIDIVKGLGWEHTDTLGMVLQKNKRQAVKKWTKEEVEDPILFQRFVTWVSHDGMPTFKNFCQVNGEVRKFEPILIFRRPSKDKYEDVRRMIDGYDYYSIKKDKKPDQELPEGFKLINGDSLKKLKLLHDNSIDSVVCDPPYGIDFLGKDWDKVLGNDHHMKSAELAGLTGKQAKDFANDLAFQEWLNLIFKECIRVLKPGGFLIGFSATRTYHHTAMAAQYAGFAVKDQLQWVFYTGFPKGQDIGKAIDKKNGIESKWEDKVVNETENAYKGVTKPFCKKCGVEKYIYQKNGCADPECIQKPQSNWYQAKDSDATVDIASGSMRCKKCDMPLTTFRAKGCDDPDCKGEDKANNKWGGWNNALKPSYEPAVLAQKPLNIGGKKATVVDNIQHHGTGAMNIDAVRVGDFKPTQPSTGTNVIHREMEGGDEDNSFEHIPDTVGRYPTHMIGTEEAYEYLGIDKTYFYCPKPSKKERNFGMDPDPIVGDKEKYKDHPNWTPDIGKNPSRMKEMLRDLAFKEGKVINNHPTLKPIGLMEHLIKLVTVEGGTVLDPFMGSGSCGVAAKLVGCKYIGIDLDERYVKVAKRRIKSW